jgi:hypothetical protein
MCSNILDFGFHSKLSASHQANQAGCQPASNHETVLAVSDSCCFMQSLIKADGELARSE